MGQYTPPIADLLLLADIDRDEKWPDYLARGFAGQHIPELSRLATESAMIIDPANEEQAWAPIHALRILALLRDGSVIGTLFQAIRLHMKSDGDIVLDEIPRIFGLIGPRSLPALAAFLADGAEDQYGRWAVADAIAEIGNEYPEVRTKCLEILVAFLDRATERDAEVNAAAIGALVRLQAVEAVSSIEKAFAAGKVAEGVCGDWEYVRYKLGLGPKPHRTEPNEFGLPWPVLPGLPHTPGAKSKAKAKRKQARKSRKRNRRK